ncbi:Fucose 4-O-acetylase [Eubacterium ruminantium]|nr:Fucose 4-O-acetylase [Eubacterium ruminantium]
MEKSRAVNRIDWIDIAKFFGAMLVVMGHTLTEDRLGRAARGAIYSFHMPLFFIVGGMTFKFSKDIEDYKVRMKRSAKHLLIPVAFIIIARIFVYNIHDLSVMGSINFWKSNLYTVIFARGIEMDYGGIHAYAIGMPWFFFAYFIAREIFDYLHLKFGAEQFPIVCVFTGILGMCCRTLRMAFSIDSAMVAVLFLLIGHMLMDRDLNKKLLPKLVVFGVLWYALLRICFPNLWLVTYFEFATKDYSIVPVSILTAVLGSLIVFYVSIILEKVKPVRRPLSFFGKNALTFFLVHCVDILWKELWECFDNQFVRGGIRFLLDTAVFATLMMVIYLIKKAGISGQKN